jgi:ribosomal protein S18 acetylase RimI-like enzyme
MKVKLDGIEIVEVRETVTQDARGLIEAVLGLQREWLVDASSNAGQDGFLISRFDEAELARLVSNGGVLYCLRDELGLSAYLLMVPGTEFLGLFENPETGVLQDGPEKLDRATLRYLSQIAVARRSARTGVGSLLLKRALERAGGPVVTDVLVTPLFNRASCEFFVRNGFEERGELRLARYRDFGALVARVFVWGG